MLTENEWRNRRGGGQGAECPLETSDQEIFADVSGKKKLEMEVGKVIKRGEDLFFLFVCLFVCFCFVFCLFCCCCCFVLFFFFAILFLKNDGNLFWVYQNENFLDIDR